MSKNNLNSEIDQALFSLNQKKKNKANPNKIKFTEEAVKRGCFKKYAFDVYKVDNDPYESLWTLEEFEDGFHLVRASEPKVNKENRGSWEAVSDHNRENITLTYKEIPIARFSSKEYGFGPEEAITFKAALLESIETDDSFVKNILLGQPSGKREALALTFPEFKKII